MSFLLSNIFILIIFKLSLNIKYCIQVLTEINFNFKQNMEINNKIKPIVFYPTRSFATYTKNNNINDFENNNLDQDNLSNNPDKSLKKQLKEFKKAYGGGYLGYTHIYNFGHINQFASYSSQLEFDNCKAILESKLKDYVYVIPETDTYSILPVLRLISSTKNKRSFSISDSIKINKYISTNLLAKQIIHDIADILKDYTYKDVIMNNYGDPVYDKINNLIGYKIDNSTCVSIKTYYNDNNLLCNKVSIREFDVNSLSFKPYILREWIDIKTDTGFIREYNNRRYFYNINNNIYNVEIDYSYPSFPIKKKDAYFNTSIGTLDLETYGENLGLGYHTVYAGG